MRVAAAALNQTPLDWNRNVDNIRCALEWARNHETMVVCLPELCISGVGCGLHFKRPAVVKKSLDILFELLPELEGMIVTLGLPLEYDGHLFNAVCLVVDGKPFGFQCKTNFTGPAFQELQWFRPWLRGRHVPFERNGQTYKLGDMSFEFKMNEEQTFRVAVEVGEPDWNAAATEKREHDVDLLLHCGASAFSFEKHAARLRYVKAATEKFGYTHVFSNYVGNESGPVVYDGGSFVVEKGILVAQTPRFSFHDVQATAARLRKDPKEHAAINVPVDDFGKEEEFSHAVPLGMLDYLRKCRAAGFALSLSGGADSASLAVLVALGVRIAWTQLGREGFLSEFDFVPGLQETQTPRDAVKCFLTCIYQSTRNSGATTRQAARTVAEELGAEFHELDVDALVEQYVAIVSKALGRELTWENDDVALQNIQARTRLPSAWLFANVRNSLLLATGNRSEATTGYTTMDGDTGGCLAPIGGVDKAFLRRWLSWMETVGPFIGAERVAMPFLRAINEQTPTAELRPPEFLQSDEKDMMPYSVLNRIEQLALAQRKDTEKVLDTLCGEFPEYDRETLKTWLVRFFRLWHRNQWKRRRYALSFHLDDASLSADDACRFPVLSGPWSGD